MFKTIIALAVSVVFVGPLYAQEVGGGTVEGAANGAARGAMVGGPHGAAVGAAVGGARGTARDLARPERDERGADPDLHDPD